VKKSLTREQAESRQAKAVRFVRDVLDDPERAAEIEDEDVADYAERRGFELTNSGRRTMPNGGNSRTKSDLLDEIRELQEQNEELQNQIDTVLDVLAPAEEDEEEEEEDDDDDQD
jgi:hypothetical protein